MGAAPVRRRKGAGSGRFSAEVAGFSVQLGSDSAGIISILRRRYGAFGSGAAADSFKFTARERPGRGLPFKPAVLQAGSLLSLARGDFRAGLDLAGGSGTLEAAANEQCLDAFLRSLLSSLLLRSGGLMLHSAGLVKGGRAYIFPGVSGAGKSTLSKLGASAGAEVVSDEICLLRPGRNGWRVHGSPFWGEMRADGRPGSWPLGGIFFPVKARRGNAAVPCGRAEAARRLLRCLVNFEKGPEAAGLALDAVLDLIAKTGAYRLEFSKGNAGFLELIG